MTSAMMQSAKGGGSSRYGGQSRSSLGIGGAIAVHGVLAGAFLLMPKEAITPYVPQILIGTQIPLTPPPPPEPVEKASTEPRPKAPINDAPRAAEDPQILTLPENREPVIVGPPASGQGEQTLVPPVDPPKPPVTVEPVIDSRALSTFQPDYPGSMVRQGIEGSVTVRVTIGPDGRVTAIERIAASDNAFWIVTQRHALRKWRFRPATRGGVAVDGTKVLTVHFKLEDR